MTDPKAIVAATLRQIAQWPAMSAEECHQLAEAVERQAPDDACCAMCEEVTCDEGCPLEGIRPW